MDKIFSEFEKTFEDFNCYRFRIMFQCGKKAFITHVLIRAEEYEKLNARERAEYVLSGCLRSLHQDEQTEKKKSPDDPVVHIGLYSDVIDNVSLDSLIKVRVFKTASDYYKFQKPERFCTGFHTDKILNEKGEC